MEQIRVILAKVTKFGQRILIFRLKKPRSKTKMGQNDPFRRPNVNRTSTHWVNVHHKVLQFVAKSLVEGQYWI